MKKLLVGTFGTVALIALATGGAVSAAPKSGGTINVVIQPEPPGLVLGITQNGPTAMVASNIY
jgi:peptide/nickel transport system substrate-binding protein